jgi:hypothetical protein
MIVAISTFLPLEDGHFATRDGYAKFHKVAVSM